MENIDLSNIVVPQPHGRVFKDECMFSFDNAFSKSGLDICLSCHQAFSRDGINYTQMHSEFFDHGVFLNCKKIRKIQRKDENPTKMIKLAVKDSSEDDLFDVNYSIYLQKSDTSVDFPNDTLPLKVQKASEAIINSTSSDKRQEIMSWEQEIKPCKHSSEIDQESIENLQLVRCSNCDLTENLWICLHCGSLGCGRSQFGGVLGNSHAMEHQKLHSDHCIAVKLGSLSSDIADCYCYSCDDEVKVPNLSKYLQTFGIDITKFVRTEKSLTELQIEQNIQWDFKMVGDEEEALKPIFGAGLTGFKNLGNSCYMASVLQALFNITSIKTAFYNENGMPLDKILGNLKPYEDLETQMFKIGDGLYSGRYSEPSQNTSEAIKYQEGIKPSGFKSLVGQGHAEFGTMLQQDAFEFWSYLVDKLEKQKIYGQSETSPLNVLKFVVEDKIKCWGCNGVRIKQQITDSLTIPLRNDYEINNEGTKIYSGTTMEESFANWNMVENFTYSCPKCKSNQSATKCQSLKALPQYLVVNPQRIQLENWVPTKLAVPIKFDEQLNLERFRGQLVTDEELIVDDEDKQEQEQVSEFEFDQVAMNSLLDMGFSENRIKHALYNTGNKGAEVAMNWLFGHMDDPQIDEPFVFPTSGTTDNKLADPDKIISLVSMGFGETLAQKALILNGQDVELSVEWLFNNPEDDGVITIESELKPEVKDEKSQIDELVQNDNTASDFELISVICHKGTSVHSGHYVAFVKKEIEGIKKWVLFNDEKVVLTDASCLKEIESNGYIYVYQRS